LFNDVLAGILTRREMGGVSVAEPADAAAAIAAGWPSVTVVDEATDPRYLVEILAGLRKLPASRLILLGQESNDMVVFDSRCTTIEELDDLMKAVGVAGGTGAGEASLAGGDPKEDPPRAPPGNVACLPGAPALGRK
jgi:hypothetical protein